MQMKISKPSQIECSQEIFNLMRQSTLLSYMYLKVRYLLYLTVPQLAQVPRLVTLAISYAGTPGRTATSQSLSSPQETLSSVTRHLALHSITLT